jgi:CHAT domain-containing protein
MRPLIALILISLSFPSFGSPDSLLAAHFVELAQQSVKTNPDSSRLYLERSLQLFRQDDDLTNWIKAHKQVAVAFDEAGQPEKALESYRMASKEHLFRQPKSAAEWEALAWLYVNSGFTQKYSLGRFSDAADSYGEAQRIFEKQLKSENDLLVADFVYRELGNIYTRFGDSQAAKVLFDKMKKTGLHHRDYGLAADACTELGIVHHHAGDPKAAIESYREGLNMPQLSVVVKGSLQVNLAKAYSTAADNENTLKYARLAEQSFLQIIREDLHPKGKAWLASIYPTYAEVYGRQGKLAMAESNLRKGLSLLKEIYPDTLRREIGKVHFALGELYRQFDRPEQALDHYQMALHCVLNGFKTNDPLANPEAASFYAENTIMEALGGKAQAFESLFEHHPDNRAWLEKSIQCHDLLFEAEKEYRRVHHYQSSKLTTVAESCERSEKAIEAVWRASQVLQDEKLLEKAFHFAEKSRSSLLYEALRHSDASSVANVPASLLRQEIEINERLTDLEKALFLCKQKGDAGQTERLQNEAFNAAKALADLRKTIETNYPEFYRLKYRQDALGAPETRRLLKENQALVEYFVGDSAIFVFLLKQDGFTVKRVKKDFPLEQWVTQFRQGIEAFQFPGSKRDSLCAVYTKLGQSLYQKLLQPLEKQGLPKNLVIVPGGILGFLPFDALLYEKPAVACAFQKYPYLVRRHNISYNYSSTLFKELLQPDTRQATKGFAAFAPSFPDNNGSGFGALQFNIPGAEEIAALTDGDLFQRDEATAVAFRRQAGDYGLLYLSTHAKANTDEGDFSFIVLAHEKGGYDTLFVKDIYNLPLAADLVFLGACETGSGEWYNGEGIISLARSFLYAGARSIVTTLWSVNDQSNKSLTTSFFHRLWEGAPKDEALRFAKLDQLENAPQDLYAHPVYWAAYTPIGNMSPVKTGLPWAGLLTGCGAVALAGAGFYRAVSWKKASNAMADSLKQS